MAFDPSGSFIEYTIRVDTTEAELSLSTLNRLVTEYVALARRVGLPENMMQAITTIMQLKVAFELAKRSALEFWAATGPIGWIIGFGGMALSGMMLYDQMEMRRPRY